MIKVDLTIAIAIYLFILVIGFLIIWLISNYTRKDKASASKENSIWQCAVCTHIYVLDENQDISRCPSCKSYNKRAHKLANDSEAKL